MKTRDRQKGEGSIYKRKDSPKWWIKYYKKGEKKAVMNSQGKVTYKYCPYSEPTGHRPNCGPVALVAAGKKGEAAALAYLAKVMQEVHSAELGHSAFAGTQVHKLRMAELFDRLEKHRKADEMDGKVRQDAGWYSHLKKAREWFGDLLAQTLDADFWDGWIQETGAELLETFAPATVNRRLEKVSEALSLAVERRVLPYLPGKVRMYSEAGNVRKGFFERNEFHALLEQTDNADYRDFYTFGYLIGWRRNAIAKLEWSSVDMQRGTITMDPALDKTGEGNKIPISQILKPLIGRRLEQRGYVRPDGVSAISTYVFHVNGAPIGEIRKAWATSCRKAYELFIASKGKKGALLMRPETDRKGKPVKDDDGNVVMEPARIFHDFRRSAYLRMIEQGVPEKTAMTIVGHKTQSMADRYQIVALRHKEEALDRLSL